MGPMAIIPPFTFVQSDRRYLLLALSEGGGLGGPDGRNSNSCLFFIQMEDTLFKLSQMEAASVGPRAVIPPVICSTNES